MSRPTLSEMDATYIAMVKKARENWPPSSLDIYAIREQEFLIDSERSQQGLPLRFHTAEQLAILLEPDRENQTDEGHFYARSALLERHCLGTSAAESLRYRFERPHEMSMDPHSDELNTVASLWSAPPAIRGPPALLRAASGDQVATGLTSGLGAVPAHARAAGAGPAPEPAPEPSAKRVTVEGRTTLTVDGLIAELQALRDKVGGAAPVWRDLTDGSELFLCAHTIDKAERDLSGGVVLV